MQIKVNEQPQRFYLAGEKWVPAVGHEIQVGEYRFCAIPTDEFINVSEVTSGAKVYSINMTPSINLQTQTQEDTMAFFERIGKSLRRIIEQNDFNSMVADMRQTAVNKLGEMPEIEDVVMT